MVDNIPSGGDGCCCDGGTTEFSVSTMEVVVVVDMVGTIFVTRVGSNKAFMANSPDGSATVI